MKPQEPQVQVHDAGFDALHCETQEDIAYHLADSGVSGLDEADTLANLKGLVEQPAVKLARVPAADVALSPTRQLSEVAVQKYAQRLQSGETPPPIVVDRSGGKYRLLEGGHRLAAAQRVGATIPIADITGIKAAGWDTWLHWVAVFRKIHRRSGDD